MPPFNCRGVQKNSKFKYQVMEVVFEGGLHKFPFGACSGYVFPKVIQYCQLPSCWGSWFLSGRSGTPIVWAESWVWIVKDKRFWYLLIASSFVSRIDYFWSFLNARSTSLPTYLYLYVWLYGVLIKHWCSFWCVCVFCFALFKWIC